MLNPRKKHRQSTPWRSRSALLSTLGLRHPKYPENQQRMVMLLLEASVTYGRRSDGSRAMLKRSSRTNRTRMQSYYLPLLHFRGKFRWAYGCRPIPCSDTSRNSPRNVQKQRKLLRTHNMNQIHKSIPRCKVEHQETGLSISGWRWPSSSVKGTNTSNILTGCCIWKEGE